MVHDPHFSPVASLPAKQVDPVRWGGLDPRYITTPYASVRFFFYGPDTSSFSPTIFPLDELTKSVGSKWISAHIPFSYASAVGYKGPVVELFGSLNQAHCLNNGAPCDQAKLQVSEAAFWPDSKNFTMVMIPLRSSHMSSVYC
jgi:hypothetical protein